ncbi:MAG: hypothetical protein HY801_16460 [Candidatus Lindowbacteria bacterium]|nr:hypothetical protein [Candidatus Lindowbacteria bacterium]
MHQYFLAPLLTERDDAESGEGGIDPLGTEPLADALAVKLAPGVRERQQHPRFLTAMAVSLEICRDFDEDTLAADGVSAPWIVFEWYLVEGLVRSTDASERLGLPGSLKATRARDDGVPLSARRYLKTIFGFHGVYRQLARTLGIEDNGRLDDNGFELLSVWAVEQGLAGFAGTGDGPGQAVRTQLEDAVRAGLESGTTKRSGGWSGWEFFRKHLAPYRAGEREARFITTALLNDPKGFRHDVMEFLISAKGRRVWEATNSEREFHRALRVTAQEEFCCLLDAIDGFESFSRLCQDAFQDCLFEMTRQHGQKTSLASLAALRSVQLASKQVPKLFGEVITRLEAVGEDVRFSETFAGLAERGSAKEWVERLIKHHLKTQKRKPPNGKNPWFEQFEKDGSLIIRPGYRTEEPGTHDDRYVHLYRTRSLWQFARDLYLVRP